MTDYVVEDEDEDEDFIDADTGEVRPCDCDPFKSCEHRNYYIDSETQVQRVCSGWVEGGRNLILYGSHGNWLLGIKETETPCHTKGEDFDHSWCFQDDCHFAEASKYKSDAVGLPLTVAPGWVSPATESEGPRYARFPIHTSRTSRGLIQRVPSVPGVQLGGRVAEQVDMLRDMLRVGVINESAYQRELARLQREAELQAARAWFRDGSWTF